MENNPASLLEVAVKFKGRPAALEAHRSILDLLKSSTKKRDQKQVMASYRYIVRNDGEDTDALNDYARYLLGHEGSPDEALRMAGKAVKIEPGIAEYLDTLAECYFRLGQKELAVAAAREALEVAERRKWAFYERRLKELKAKDPPKKKL
jgi:tetratricopeptide (TPR) repeat protein